MTRRLAPGWWWALVIAATVVVIDQITKAVAVTHVSASPTHVWGPFGLALAFNTGSAFSLFQGASGALAVVDLLLIAVLVVVGVRSAQRGIQVGIGLMLGGAIGNLADRAVRGSRGVVDFITLSHWPTFNAADASITIGAIVVALTLLIDVVRPGPPEETP